jgi:hypothetical protein
MLAAGGMNGGLMIYDLRNIQTPLMKFTGHDTSVKSLCFSEKDKTKEKDSKEPIKAKAFDKSPHHKYLNASEN